jgi:hypothetical protein
MIAFFKISTSNMRIEIAIGIAVFVVGIAIWPGIAGYGIVLRWSLFGVAVALLMLRKFPWHPVHGLIVVTLAWAALGIFWQPVWADGVNGFIQLTFLAAALAIGLEITDARPIIAGLAMAVAVSFPFVMAQAAGYHPVPAVNVPAGLFANRIMLGETAGIALIGAIAFDLWILAIPTAACVVLSQCRGAWLACGLCGLLWLWGQSRLAAVITVGTFGILIFLSISLLHRERSSIERLYLWQDAIDGISLRGNGIGSFNTVSPAYGHRVAKLDVREDHAHNDILELVFELGIGSALVLFIGVIALGGIGPERWPFYAFLGEGLVGFPLHSPTTGMVGALLAGVLCASRRDLWRNVDVGRGTGFWRNHAAASLPGEFPEPASCCGDIPVGLFHPGKSSHRGNKSEGLVAATIHSHGGGGYPAQ